MAEVPDFVTRIAKAQLESTLLPAKHLVSNLMQTSLPPSEQETALLGQVALAKKRNQKSWLQRVAGDADCLQFHSRQWITENIHPLPEQRRPKKKKKAQVSGDTSRDYRLKENPDLQIVKVEMGREEDENPQDTLAADDRSTPVASVSGDLPPQSKAAALEQSPRTSVASELTPEPQDAETASGSKESTSMDKEMSRLEAEMETIDVSVPRSWAEEVDRDIPMESISASSETALQPMAAAPLDPPRDRTPPPTPRPQEQLRRSPRKHKSSGAAYTATSTSAGRMSPDRRHRRERRYSPVHHVSTGEKRRRSR